METPENMQETNTGDSGEPPRKSSGPVMRIVATVSVVLGVAGIAWIIHSLGLESLAKILSQMSLPRFAILLVWYYLVYVFDALAWRQLIHKDNRPGLWPLWKATIAGASINQLTPGGNIGEPIKIMLLKGKTDTQDTIAALVVWNFMYLVVTMLWVLIGAIPIFMFLKADAGFVLLYLAGAVVLGFPALLIVLTLKYNILSRLASLLGRMKVTAGRLLVWQEKVEAIEHAVLNGIQTRPRDIAISTAHLMVSRGISITMAFGMVWVLNLEIPFITVLYIQMLNLAVSTLFSFVPARIGVVEGYNAMIFKALDYTPQAGIGVSIVTRIIQVVTTIMGVAILAGHRRKL